MHERDDLEARLARLDATIAQESASGGDRLALARALHLRAHTLQELGRLEEARAALLHLAYECREDPDPLVERVVTAAVYDRALLLWNIDDPGRCLLAIEEFLNRLGIGAASEDQRRLLRIYRIRAEALLQVGRPAEALVVCEAALARFGEQAADNDALAAELERVLPVRARALGAVGRRTEARELCDRLLIEQLRERDIPPRPTHAQAQALAELVWLRVHLIDFGAAPDEVVGELRALVQRLPNAGGAVSRELLELSHTLFWWLLQALRIDEALALCDERLKRFDSETDPSSLVPLAEALEADAHTLIYHGRFARQRRNLPLAIAVRITDALDPPAPVVRGRLAATIALRRRLRDQAVAICQALSRRLDGEADPHLRQIRAESMLTEAEAWASSLHVLRATRLWGASSQLGDGTWAAFNARAERSERRGELPLLVIGNTLMGAIVGNDAAHTREVAAELVARYQHDRAPSTRIAVAVARLLSR